MIDSSGRKRFLTAGAGVAGKGNLALKLVRAADLQIVALGVIVALCFKQMDAYRRHKLILLLAKEHVMYRPHQVLFFNSTKSTVGRRIGSVMPNNLTRSSQGSSIVLRLPPQCPLHSSYLTRCPMHVLFRGQPSVGEFVFGGSFLLPSAQLTYRFVRRMFHKLSECSLTTYALDIVALLTHALAKVVGFASRRNTLFIGRWTQFVKTRTAEIYTLLVRNASCFPQSKQITWGGRHNAWPLTSHASSIYSRSSIKT